MSTGHADEGGRRVDNQWILVVEDSAEDAEAIERALNRTHPDLRLEFTDHGEGIAERLLDAAELPGLVLLDFNMPGLSGHAVLSAIRSHPQLAEVTLIVFTSSTSPAEVDACYAAGADSYIYKPVNFALFRTVLKGAIDYWQQTKGQAEPDVSAPGSPSVK